MHAEIVALIATGGIAALAILLISMMFRRQWDSDVTEYAGGLILAFTAAIGMSLPLMKGPFGILDLRAVFLVIAAALFGWRGGLVACLMIGLLRLALGGNGVVTGTFIIAFSFLIGMGWRQILGIRRLSQINLSQVSVLGVATLVISGIAVLRAWHGGETNQAMLLLYIVAHLAGIMLMGAGIIHEHRMNELLRWLRYGEGRSLRGGLLNKSEIFLRYRNLVARNSRPPLMRVYLVGAPDLEVRDERKLEAAVRMLLSRASSVELYGKVSDTEIVAILFGEDQDEMERRESEFLECLQATSMEVYKEQDHFTLGIRDTYFGDDLVDVLRLARKDRDRYKKELDAARNDDRDDDLSSYDGDEDGPEAPRSAGQGAFRGEPSSARARMAQPSSANLRSTRPLPT